MMNRLRGTFGVLLAVSFLACGGCSWLLGSDDEEEAGRWIVQPGAIIFYGDTSAVVLASDTVHAGVSLRVTATTFGGGCTRAAGMEVEVRDLTATLTPMDSVYLPGPNEACAAILIELEHSADVMFARPGEARIVIEGVERGANAERETVRLERTVVVE